VRHHALGDQAEAGNGRHEDDKVVELRACLCQCRSWESTADGQGGARREGQMAYSIARVRALLGICTSLDKQSPQIRQVGRLQCVSIV
jgi:hypothetical protein